MIPSKPVVPGAGLRTEDEVLDKKEIGVLAKKARGSREEWIQRSGSEETIFMRVHVRQRMHTYAAPKCWLQGKRQKTLCPTIKSLWVHCFPLSWRHCHPADRRVVGGHAGRVRNPKCTGVTFWCISLRLSSVIQWHPSLSMCPYHCQKSFVIISHS